MKYLITFILGISLILAAPGDEKEAQVKADGVKKADLQKVIEDVTTGKTATAVKQETVMTENTIQVGIKSIDKNKDGTYTIAVYILNPVPIAGFQMDIGPKNIFEYQSITGGISEELGFMMKAGKSGRILGFSMQGSKIPVASSKKIEDNILYYLNATMLPEAKAIAELKDKKDDKKEISFDLVPILAGEKGVKLSVYSEPFVWKIK